MKALARFVGEAKLGVLASQCLDRRIADKQILPRSQRMAGPPQQAPRQGQLAIQNSRRPRQAEETVPSVRVIFATRIRCALAMPNPFTCSADQTAVSLMDTSRPIYSSIGCSPFNTWARRPSQ